MHKNMILSVIMFIYMVLAGKGDNLNYIKRAMEDTFLRLSEQFPAVLVTGPRQVGKTTMLMKLMQEEGNNRDYVSLDDLFERDIAKNDPKMFLELHKPPIFIDEVQHAPELFTYIKIYIDKHNNPGDFWLTGSQAYRQMRGIQESLAGRVCLLNMHSISQAEACGVPTRPFEIDLEKLITREKEVEYIDSVQMYQRIWEGGMPALLSGQYTDRRAVYSSYVSTYIERDAKDISGAINTLQFMNFVTAAAALTGQMLNYKTIAQAAGISEAKAKEWLGILEMLGIIFYLRPYSNNVLKRTVSTPKLYFFDSGLVAYLTRWSDCETLMSGAMSGAILENFVVSEIIKSYNNCGLEPFVYYYRDKDTKEIDIIMESDGKLYPMEIKKATMPAPQTTRAFSVIDKSPLIRGTSAVLCLSDKLSAFDRNNLIVPIWLI